jgi:hypothetical protein
MSIKRNIRENVLTFWSVMCVQCTLHPWVCARNIKVMLTVSTYIARPLRYAESHESIRKTCISCWSLPLDSRLNTVVHPFNCAWWWWWWFSVQVLQTNGEAVCYVARKGQNTVECFHVTRVNACRCYSRMLRLCIRFWVPHPADWRHSVPKRPGMRLWFYKSHSHMLLDKLTSSNYLSRRLNLST